MLGDNDTAHKTTPQGAGEMSEAEIDKNLQDTFPASDPPSWTLGTNHREEQSVENDGQAEDDREA
jgi:hypothetical protein